VFLRRGKGACTDSCLNRGPDDPKYEVHELQFDSLVPPALTLMPLLKQWERA
jgi:hypothetical protein